MGVESVYIDVNSFAASDRIDVSCKAFWYGARNSGDMSLDIRAFKGGVMQKSASDPFQFVNNGGFQVGNLISFSKNISSQINSCRVEGENIGTVSYDRQTQVLTFQ